jgi:hypothetical protein
MILMLAYRRPFVQYFMSALRGEKIKMAGSYRTLDPKSHPGPMRNFSQ